MKFLYLRFFCFSVFLFTAQYLLAQKTDNTVFTPNQKLYVFSFNALNLRDSANSKSKIIKTLAFGDTVEVVEMTTILCPVAEIFKKDTAKPKENEYNENPVTDNLNLQGNWVRVKHRNEVGYVNAIYLSALPHFANLSKKWTDVIANENGKNNNDLIGEENFRLLNKHYGIPFASPQLTKKALFYKVVKIKKDLEVKKSFRKTYKDGLTYLYTDSYYDEGAGGYDITIKMKGISFAEAVMFCRAFFNYSNTTYKIGIGFFKSEDGEYTITSYGEGGGCTGKVFKDKNGDWVINYGCGGC
jgi:hypothetical protein